MTTLFFAISFISNLALLKPDKAKKNSDTDDPFERFKKEGTGTMKGEKEKSLKQCSRLEFLSPGYYSAGEIASVGHTSAQDPQSVQSSGSIT